MAAGASCSCGGLEEVVGVSVEGGKAWEKYEERACDIVVVVDFDWLDYCLWPSERMI